MRLIDADELIIPSEEMIARMVINNAPTVEASNIIDGLNNEIDDLSENLAWYINERNRLLKERRPTVNVIKTVWVVHVSRENNGKYNEYYRYFSSEEKADDFINNNLDGQTVLSVSEEEVL